MFLMNPSGEHAVRAGKYDGFVTRAECARTLIPDAPLPQLCGGPAYELAG
ncbi:MAG: hypothetical protein QOC89_6271 [Paraburkholderia sp.]|nr:hypothetical protein [Paraburkholderia sp.]